MYVYWMHQSETRKQLTKEKDIEVPVSSEEEQGTKSREHKFG